MRAKDGTLPAMPGPTDLTAVAARLHELPRRFRDEAQPFADRDLRGSFSHRPGRATDVYGSADLVFVLWIVGELETRTTPTGRREWISRIQSFQDPATGYFDRGFLAGHGPAHATGFATAALRLLGAQPAHPFRWAESLFGSRERVESWLDSLNWNVVWTGSHGAGTAAALLDAPSLATLPRGWEDWVLEGLAARVDPGTGFWKRGLLDRLLRRPTTVDLGGAAHFWWLYDRLQKPIPSPRKAIDGILSLQRPSGLWGTRLLNGNFPQGVDFDALHGLMCGLKQLPGDERKVCGERIVAAIKRYGDAVARHFADDRSLGRLLSTSHKVVGTLNAIAEANGLYALLTGSPRFMTPRAWRSALTAVSWQ